MPDRPAPARYKDLCLDAVDTDLMSRFWAGALGLHVESGEAGPVPLTGGEPPHTVWINPVAEPKTVKHRLHLDLNVSSVQELVDLGATVVDADSFPWTIMADPEGGELCAFVREGEITRRLYEIGVDSAEPHAIAAWWGELLGARLVREDDQGYSYLEEIPGAPFDSLDFVPVPEPKTVKNRVHLDVTTPDVGLLLDAGARLLRAPDEDIDWHVLADPEGNEFCAFVQAR